MNILDLTKEEIIFSTRNPSPIFSHLSSERYLHEKYILKNNVNIEGIYNVDINIGNNKRTIINAEVKTIENHTVITRFS